MVVHRQPEEHDEEKERQPRDDRAVRLEAEQRLGPVVLEDEHEHAVRGADREQVEDDRLQRHDDRAEGDEQQQEARSTSTNAITYGTPCFICRVKSTSSAVAPGDRGLDARDARRASRARARRAGSAIACLLAALSLRRRAGARRDAAVPVGVAADRERRMGDAARRPRAARVGQRRAAPSAAARAARSTTTIAGSAVPGKRRELPSVASAGSLCAESDSSLGFATCSQRAGNASATSNPAESTHERAGRRRTRSTTAGQKRESARLRAAGAAGTECAAVDVRAEQLEHGRAAP